MKHILQTSVNSTHVAFQSYRDGNWEIYVADGDGGRPVRLTDESTADVLPRLDAAASQVVYASKRGDSFDILSVRTDASDRKIVVASGDDDTQPSVTSDGECLAFARVREDSSDIYTVSMNGGEPIQITSDAEPDFDPAWSRNGAQLAWLRASGLAATVVVANPDGSNARSLGPPLRYLQHLAWSPDGKWLAFDYDVDGDGWNELAVMGVDGSNLRSGGDLLGISQTGVDLNPDWRSQDNIGPQSVVRVTPESVQAGSMTHLSKLPIYPRRTRRPR